MGEPVHEVIQEIVIHHFERASPTQLRPFGNASRASSSFSG